MHANECPEAWPDPVMRELAEVVRRIELNRYPDTSGRSLRRVLADRHGCAPERVILGNGSDEIIFIVLTALSGSLARPAAVVVPVPTFVMYGHTARVLGLELREVPLDQELQLDEAGMREALGRDAAVCFLARPNNPTGSLWDAGVVRRLIREHPSTVFVIDEAYAAYAPGTSLWARELPDNHVHMSTLSKVGLAAIRVGYAIAHPLLAAAFDKVRHPYNMSQTSLALAETVLTRFCGVQAEMIARAIANRDRLRAILCTVPGAHVYPSAGNMVLVRVGGAAEAARLQAELLARGVLVQDRSSSPGLAGCVRVSLGTAEELDLVEAALREIYG
jgi:histidinol-phosphate aminotransferase